MAGKGRGTIPPRAGSSASSGSSTAAATPPARRSTTPSSAPTTWGRTCSAITTAGAVAASTPRPALPTILQFGGPTPPSRTTAGRTGAASLWRTSTCPAYAARVKERVLAGMGKRGGRGARGGTGSTTTRLSKSSCGSRRTSSTMMRRDCRRWRPTARILPPPAAARTGPTDASGSAGRSTGSTTAATATSTTSTPMAAGTTAPRRPSEQEPAREGRWTRSR